MSVKKLHGQTTRKKNIDAQQALKGLAPNDRKAGEQMAALPPAGPCPRSFASPVHASIFRKSNLDSIMAVASHKPRRHIKDANDTVEYVQQPDLNAGPAFPLASLMWSLRGTAATWASVSVLLLVAGLFRWAVSLWPYSGFQAPPMHGDFEAQRHWMELTIHLPASRWYFYDLEWWGLDYPPLTAYHSWLLGKMYACSSPRGISRGCF